MYQIPTALPAETGVFYFIQWGLPTESVPPASRAFSSSLCLFHRINLFTNSLEGPVLDHRYYAGGCSPHYILNTRFRKPYNVESYTPQVRDSGVAATEQ